MTEVHPALSLTNISKDFGGLKALQNVDLVIAPGERRGILGPNGAGKTTLFHVISGLISPTSGRVKISGLDVTALPTYRRIAMGMGRTFQITNLFSKLTVEQNLLLALQGLTSKKMSMLREMRSYENDIIHARDWLEKWRLIEMRDRIVNELSYGQQRKLELLLAVCQKPSLLLLDEPTEGLSPDETAAAVKVIDELSRDIAIVLIEHDMDVVFSLCSTLTVMHLGKVLTTGEKYSVRSDPRVQEIYLGDALQ
jgi:branched-chain amino acid transport system ATP-binding protein